MLQAGREMSIAQHPEKTPDIEWNEEDGISKELIQSDHDPSYLWGVYLTASTCFLIHFLWSAFDF